MSVPVLKDAELQKYYDDLFTLFASPGWKAWVEDRKAEIKVRENLRNVKNTSVDFVKGQLDVLDYVVSAEEITRKAYDELLTQDALPYSESEE